MGCSTENSFQLKSLSPPCNSHPNPAQSHPNPAWSSDMFSFISTHIFKLHWPVRSMRDSCICRQVYSQDFRNWRQSNSNVAQKFWNQKTCHIFLALFPSTFACTCVSWKYTVWFCKTKGWESSFWGEKSFAFPGKRGGGAIASTPCPP